MLTLQVPVVNDCFVGLVVKISVSKVEDPGF